MNMKFHIGSTTNMGITQRIRKNVFIMTFTVKMLEISMKFQLESTKTMLY